MLFKELTVFILHYNYAEKSNISALDPIMKCNEKARRQADLLDNILGKSISRILSRIVIYLGPTLLQGLWRPTFPVFN